MRLLCVETVYRGVVIVDVPLSWLDINQCPQDYFVPNAFKDTARCHYDTTYVCIILPWNFLQSLLVFFQVLLANFSNLFKLWILQP